jgi:hypothetical protein
MNAPRFLRPGAVHGNKLVFRDATPADAGFILGLRTDASKNRYLSATAPDVAQQTAWLERYANDPEQLYFIIENTAGKPVGTVRLYDRRGPSFCWGSWIKADDAPAGFGIESALMVYHYALHLGFTAAHFDVRRENAGVISFHQRSGARIVDENELDYFFEIGPDEIRAMLDKYQTILPQGVRIA